MQTRAVHSIVCISNNDQWLEGVTSAAKAASASAPKVLSWAQFDSAPMEFAHPGCWAYACIADESVPLDIRLGRLCRSFPYGVLLELAASMGGSDEQLFAHGFQKYGASGEKMAPENDKHHFPDSKERCFKFRLQDYKAVPDWLNARFWAHPERFHL